MKGWMIVFRSDGDDRSDGGVEDEALTVIHRKLAKAKEECRKALREDFPEEGDGIEWGQSSKKPPRWLGRPVSDIDGYFEIFQVDIIN
jgi:hypothetical protein